MSQTPSEKAAVLLAELRSFIVGNLGSGCSVPAYLVQRYLDRIDIIAAALAPPAPEADAAGEVERADKIIYALDSIARDHNIHEYGLPVMEREVVEQMRAAISSVLAEK